MKRVAVLFVVLVVALGTALALKLRAQRLEAGRAAGGSATLEGTEVSVTSRISARVAAVRVREGATVHAGDVLVELQCDEPKAALAQTEAAVAAAQVSIAAGKLAIELAEPRGTSGTWCSAAHRTSVTTSSASTGTATASGIVRAMPALSLYTAQALASVRKTPRKPSGVRSLPSSPRGAVVMSRGPTG